ncbi:MAG: hypothetical protein LBC41_17665, partial [Clostridiales bacterium]|nr:hypothetical protein [Clostridiales bacterium]
MSTEFRSAETSEKMANDLESLRTNLRLIESEVSSSPALARQKPSVGGETSELSSKLTANTDSATINDVAPINPNDTFRLSFNQLLIESFPNGISPNLSSDINMLTRSYANTTGREITDDVTDIVAELESIGYKNEDKIYFLSEASVIKLTDLIKNSRNSGNRLLFFESFYTANRDIMQDLKISSPLHLKAAITKLFVNKYSLSKTYFLTVDNVTVESEIKRCFNDSVTLSIQNLADRLPYIPIKEIECAISKSKHVFLVGADIYAHINKVTFDEKECQEICSFVKKTVEAIGFISFSSVNGASNEKLNPELSSSSIKKMIYERYLSDKYSNRGNIVYLREAKY